MKRGPWGWQCSILAETAIDVLDIDHGIVHYLPDGNRKATKSHGVQAQPHFVEGDDSRQQRKRNCSAGDRSSAEIEEKQKENQDHEDCADEQRIAHIVKRDIDEVGRAEHFRMKRDSLCFEART